MTKIGVTGHRVLTNLDKLVHSVDQALALIEAHCDPPYICLSALAEGADRLVPYRAFARWEEARLIVPLPLDVEDYMQDFETFTSKADFINLMELAEEILPPPEAANREDAYQAAGFHVVQNCDVLIAIWDGAEAQGKGGTAEIVTTARQMKHPLIWIHAGNRRPDTEKPTSLGGEQGKITLENFDT